MVPQTAPKNVPDSIGSRSELRAGQDIALILTLAKSFWSTWAVCGHELSYIDFEPIKEAYGTTYSSRISKM